MIDGNEFKDALADITDYMYSWHEQAQGDFEFYSLKQWPKQDAAFLAEEERPALTFDRTRPIIDSIAGSEMMNRYEPKFLPRQAEVDEVDPWLGDAASEIHKYYRQFGDYEQFESSMFHSTLICGVGCTELVSDYEENPDGVILLKTVPISEIGWDPHSIEPNMKDATHVVRDKWIDKQEAESMFGSKVFNEIIAMQSAAMSQGDGLGFFGRIFTRERDDARRSAYLSGKERFFNNRTNKVRVFEFQQYQREYRTRIFVPDFDLTGMPPQSEYPESKEAEARIRQLNEMVAAFNANGERMYAETQQMASQSPGSVPPEVLQAGPPQLQPVRYIEDFPVKQYYRSWFCNNQLLKQDKMDVSGFTYQFCTAFEDWSNDWAEWKRRHFFGLMRPMRDPQRYANKFFSQAVHLFTSNPKGALLYESDLFEDSGEAGSQWNKATGMLPVQPNKLNRTNPPYKQLSTQVSMQNVEMLLGHALDSIAQSAGVSPEYFVGTVGDLKRTPAASIESVQEQNLSTVSKPFDSLRLYKKMQGRMVLDILQHRISESQIVRILGDQKGQAFIEEMNKQDLTQMYDITAQEAPTSQNKQAEVFGQLMQTSFIPQLMEMGVPIPPSLGKYFPFPPEITVEFQQALSEAYELIKTRNEIEIMTLNLQMAQMQQGVMPGMEGDPNMQEQPPPTPDEGGPPV